MRIYILIFKEGKIVDKTETSEVMVLQMEIDPKMAYSWKPPYLYIPTDCSFELLEAIVKDFRLRINISKKELLKWQQT